MTIPNERDQTLGRAIDALPVPDHQPGFWAELRSELEADATDRGVGPAPERAPVRRWRVLRPGRGHGPRLALAAAVVLVAVGAGAVAVAVNGDEDQNLTADRPTSTATTTAITSGPAPSSGGEPGLSTTIITAPVTSDGSGGVEVGEASDLGPGLVVGLSPDGRTAYLSAPDPEVDDLGCEGSDWSSLYAQPVAGGPRTRVGEPGQVSANAMVFGPDGQVALVAYCEGYLSQVWVGRLDGASVPTDLRPITPGVTYDTFSALDTLRWSADGSSLLMANVSTTGTPFSRVGVRIDPVSGRATDLGLGAVIRLAQDSAGRYAVVLDNGEIRLDGSLIGTVALSSEPDPFVGDGSTRGVTDLAVDARGAVWVATRSAGVLRIEPGGEVEVVDLGGAQRLIPNRAGMAWLSQTAEGSLDTTLRTLHANGAVLELLALDDVLLPRVSGNGDALAWTLFTADATVGTGVILPLDGTT